MKDAGLTHAGVYRHFGSREALVAEAVKHALHDGSQAVVPIANSTLDHTAELSALVGAVSLARAVNDEKLSEEILKSVADELKAQLG
ncbi:TetR family transcriptional regulator [Pseudomonas gingeri]|uniref:TetR family transcriptional regulator n=1 Tax=Pseudomonas gingeri TaxID=117681 RepID=UPI0015A23B4E|nr:TetR family transcriptional regulator [Pseudomonas gingeri]NWA23301.1 TetR family transcriptional regulator [Pseudomonas gingeri]